MEAIANSLPHYVTQMESCDEFKRHVDQKKYAWLRSKHVETILQQIGVKWYHITGDFRMGSAYIVNSFDVHWYAYRKIGDSWFMLDGLGNVFQEVRQPIEDEVRGKGGYVIINTCADEDVCTTQPTPPQRSVSASMPSQEAIDASNDVSELQQMRATVAASIGTAETDTQNAITLSLIDYIDQKIIKVNDVSSDEMLARLLHEQLNMNRRRRRYRPT